MTDTIQCPTYDDFGHITGNDRSGTAGDMSYAYDNLHGWSKQRPKVPRNCEWIETFRPVRLTFRPERAIAKRT